MKADIKNSVVQLFSKQGNWYGPIYEKCDPRYYNSI